MHKTDSKFRRFWAASTLRRSFQLESESIFSVHTRPEKFSNPTKTGHFRFGVRAWNKKGSDQSTLDKDSSVPITHLERSN